MRHHRFTCIQKLAFQLTHVRILGTNHCGEMRCTASKRRELFQDVICCRDYAESVVARSANQIQSEYYGGNRSVSIEGIALEYFSARPKADINSTTPPRQRHAEFHYFLSDNRKQDADNTTAHIKRLISFLKEKSIDNIIGKTLMVVPNNTDVTLHYTLCQLCLSVTQL